MAARRVFAGLVATAALLAVSAGPASAQALGAEASYVITFEPGADADAALIEIARTLPVTITHRFGSVLEGAVVRTEAPPEAMVMVDGVATVDRDAVIELPDPEQPDPDSPDPETPDPDQPDPDTPDPDQPDPETPDPEQPEPTLPEPVEPAPEQPDPVVSDVPWGLDRIDQRALPLSGTYTSPTAGAGVIVYVVDSGVSPHDQFGGRLAPGLDLVGDGRGTTDCEGHGTHVAGTIAGSTVGVASGATVVPVRVFDCEGTTSGARLLEALDWIAATHPAGRPGVVNYSGSMSSTGGAVAVQGLISRGLTFVTAGGNDGQSACVDTGGTGMMGSIVVGATDATDARTSWSNYGACLDLFAPGENIRSASIQAADATVAKDGTSMAAPHVAGAAAVFLALNPTMQPAQLESLLVSSATPTVSNAGSGSPNLLLYIDPAAVAVAVATPPPVVAPPAVPVEVAGTTTEPQIRAAVLAFTGGDPRALLVFGTLLLLVGAMAVVASRRDRWNTPELAGPSVVLPDPCQLPIIKRAAR
jgi:subtilisin family serine protease